MCTFDVDKALELITSYLIKNNITLSTAESCTGGLLSSKITSKAGISQIFLGGVVSYSNASKENILKVNKESLMEYGAVSKEVAKEMAIGCSRLFKTDIAISITGIAGPSGGSLDKPVGLVYIGIKYRDEILIKKCNFKGSRDSIRESTVQKVMELLANLIEEGKI